MSRLSVQYTEDQNKLNIFLNGEPVNLSKYISTLEKRQAYKTAVDSAFLDYKRWHDHIAHTSELRQLWTYKGIFIPPLFQRHFTEKLLNHHLLSAYLTPVIQAHQPATIQASPRTLIPFLSQKYATIEIILPSALAQGKEKLRSVLALWRTWRQEVVDHTTSVKPTIVFVTYYANHLRYFLPVLQALKHKDRYNIVVTGTNPNTWQGIALDTRPLLALNIPYIPYEQELSTTEVYQQIRAIQDRVQHIGKSLNNFTHKQLIYEGADRVTPILTQLITSNLPKILLYAEFGRALWLKWQPSLVILTDETLPVLGRTAITTAQQQQIPTLTLQHGVMLHDPMYYGGICADHLAVWGKATRQMLTRNGATSNQISEVGALRFDHAPNHKVTQTWTYKAALDIDESKKIVLFTSQPGGRDVPPNQNEATFIGLLSAVSALENLYLVVKPHPAQKEDELQQWHDHAAKQGFREHIHYTIEREIPLHPAMSQANLCVTIFSTTGLEALWLGAPLLIINLTDKPNLMRYPEGKFVFVAHEIEEIRAKIQQALEISLQYVAYERQQFVQLYLGPPDGRAMARLEMLIDQQINHVSK